MWQRKQGQNDMIWEGLNQLLPALKMVKGGHKSKDASSLKNHIILSIEAKKKKKHLIKYDIYSWLKKKIFNKLQS